MELTKFQRNLISRLTAVLTGLALCWVCVRLESSMRNDRRATAERPASLSGKSEVHTAPVLPRLIAFAAGVSGGGLVLVGVLPTRVLHRINPRPSTTTGSELVEAAGGLML